MKAIKNVLNLAALCLLSGQVMAETGKSTLATQVSAIEDLHFELPKAGKNIPVMTTLKDIMDRSKSGQLNAHTRLGGMDGGGGKILICPTGKGVKAKVLDVYEGESAGLQIDLGNGKTLDEKIKYVLNRLAKVAPYRARSYAIMADNLLKKESAFFSNAAMPVTDDLGVTVLPKNCAVVQVVVQRNSEDADIPGFARYLFDRDVFAQLDVDSQAALVLHEVIYRERRAAGEKTSLRARYLNYLILSTSIDKMSTESFNNVLGKMGTTCLERAGRASLSICDGLADVYEYQTVNVGDLSFTGTISIGGRSAADSTSLVIKFADEVVDLSQSFSAVRPIAGLSVRAGKKNGSLDLYVDPASISMTDSYPVEFKTARVQVKGECMIWISSDRLREKLLACNSGQLLQDGKMTQLSDSRFRINNDGTLSVLKSL